MSQRSAGSCTRCTPSNAFPGIDHDLVSNSDDLYIAFNLEKVTDYIKLHNFSQVLYGQKEHKYEKENSEEEFEPASDESYLNTSLHQDLLSFGEKSIVKKTNGKNGDPMAYGCR